MNLLFMNLFHEPIAVLYPVIIIKLLLIVIYIYYRPYKYLLATILKCIQEFFYFLLACFYLRLITINEDFLSPSKINNNSVKKFYSIGDLITDTSACFIVANLSYFVFILVTTIIDFRNKKKNPLYPE
jgi:hypothetical protein